ncbi:DUF3667 domain-containing protein [soil metagenome]
MDDLEKAIPAAEGIVEVEQSTEMKSHNEFCLNCGTKLEDTFCHHCGQKDIPRRQTLGELWGNFISSFWSYEGKFFLTTKFLVTKPGFLTTEYNAGRRESYYHPARMYAFISFVFFLIFFSLPESNNIAVVDLDDDEKEEVAQKNQKLPADSTNLKQDSLFTTAAGDSVLKNVFSKQWVDSVKKVSKKKKKIGNNAFSLSGDPYKNREQYDSTQLAKPIGERDGWFKRALEYRLIELNNRYGKDKNGFGDAYSQAFKDNFSKVLFFLLPVFALVLKLFYVRRDYFYSEHLVFSIYYYNFGYLAATLQLLVSQFPWLGWLSTLIGFWIYFYLLFAMKRMYQQSWMKTISKFFLFSFTFLLCTVFAVVVASILIFMIM